MANSHEPEDDGASPALRNAAGGDAWRILPSPMGRPVLAGGLKRSGSGSSMRGASRPASPLPAGHSRRSIGVAGNSYRGRRLPRDSLFLPSLIA